MLEAYLRAILTHKDPRWRMAYTFTDFISLAQNAPSGSGSSSGLSTGARLASHLPSSQAPSTSDTRFTSTSWLTEHAALHSLLRTIRASLLKRDALAGLGESSASRSASVEAKRLIKEARGRVDALGRGLGGVEGLGAGERARRDGLVGTVRDELANLERMAEAGVRVAQPPPASGGAGAGASPGRASSPANDAARTALLGPSASPAPSRVFGPSASVPQETAETRPLDDRGLLQLQSQQMSAQDAQLLGLSAVLRRQRRLGEEIGREIGEQNEMLDEMAGEVDRVGGKLGRAKREMNKWVTGQDVRKHELIRQWTQAPQVRSQGCARTVSIRTQSGCTGR